MDFLHHTDPKTLHINTLPPRAYYIPYENEEKARAGTANQSPFSSPFAANGVSIGCLAKASSRFFLNESYAPGETITSPPAGSMYLDGV